MSENAPEATATETDEAAQPEAPAQDPTDWKAMARKWEQQAKANKAAADKLAQLEDEQKTAEQRSAERLAAAEARAAELETKAIRAEVAAEKGVPVALLTGSTREDLEASADALIAFRGEQKPGGPKPDLSQGAKGKQGAGTAADQFEQFFSQALNT